MEKILLEVDIFKISDTLTKTNMKKSKGKSFWPISDRCSYFMPPEKKENQRFSRGHVG